ncbi:MAG: SDR family oxidoreductase [Chlorobiaceae bacterium]|nr:SDR family oxidoreductase [Chlorobiaceae bacterium]NTV61642.1 SDR family oxidoreductase [Chlorobiaceae bacterium]
MKPSGRKVCFMTGASGKLGSEIALSIAGQGYTVFFTWHASEEKALDLLDKIRWLSPESMTTRCDVSKTADIAAAFDLFRKNFPKLDLLMASASNFFGTPLPDVSEEQWDSLVDTNLKGTFFTMQEAVRIMQNQDSGGKIITMSDIAAGMVWRDFAPYTVSKAGIQHLTRIFAKKYAPGILVNSIAPGTVSQALESIPGPGNELIGKIPLGRLGDPLDIVKTILFLLENDYITGQVINVDGGRLLH